MINDSKKKLRWATIIFWFLLLYIIAALVWWFLILENQNQEIHALKTDSIQMLHSDTARYAKELAVIENQKKWNTIKYICEGTTFLLFIIVCAVFIFRTVRRHFRLQQQQQNFVMAITHELKTPIAIARLNLETIQKYQLDDEKRNKLMSTTLLETLRLDMLINNILLSSQLEGHSYHMSKEELDFSQLAADTAQQFSIRYHNRNISNNIQPGIEITGDPLLLKLLISNLLENAHKYSPIEGLITFELKAKGKEIVLKVTDEGSGIEEGEKKKIFDKFYRIGNEQTRKTKGTGLGLFLCKIITHDHHGSITVSNNQPHGSIFRVLLHSESA